jgi:hypothetical protein
MSLHAVFRTNKEDGDRGYGMIMVHGRKYHVFRASPLFGDMGYGTVKVNGKTYTVYRTKKEDGDIGYGVVNIQYKSEKKQSKNDTKKLPEDLAEIIRVWPELPEHIKSRIEALVQTHSTEVV